LVDWRGPLALYLGSVFATLLTATIAWAVEPQRLLVVVGALILIATVRTLVLSR
jgi:hypothetical protein